MKEKIKKLVELYKKEKWWNSYMSIRGDVIIFERTKIFDIPNEDKRDYCTQYYNIENSSVKYYCWKESHHNGDHYDYVNKRLELTEEQEQEMLKKVLKKLRSVAKDNYKSKVIDIVCELYLDKKLNEMEGIEEDMRDIL